MFKFFVLIVFILFIQTSSYSWDNYYKVTVVHEVSGERFRGMSKIKSTAINTAMDNCKLLNKINVNGCKIKQIKFNDKIENFNVSNQKVSSADTSEFWSNIVDGPKNKEQAIKILEGRKLDKIEGLWSDEELGTLVIFKKDDVFKVYIVDGPTDFNGTLEATVIKTDDEYDFLARVWYNEIDGYTFTTQTGTLEVFDNYILTKFDSLSDGGVNMDSKYTRVWPNEKSLEADKNKINNLDEKEKKFYELRWFNLDDPKNHWVEIENSNSEFNILETEIYLKGQRDIDEFSNLLFGENAAENDLLIQDNENFDYSIYINYVNSGFVSIENWKKISSKKIMQELRDTANKDVSRIRWINEPEITDKNYIIYSYETNWTNGDKTFETKIIYLGRMGYNEVVFVFKDDGNLDYKESMKIAKEFADVINFKEGFKYKDYKTGDTISSDGISELLTDSLGIESIEKSSNSIELLGSTLKYFSYFLYPVFSIFNYNS